MSVPSMSAPVVSAASSAPTAAPTLPKPAEVKSTQDTADQPAATVTISDSAKRAVAANQQPEQSVAKKASVLAQQSTATTQPSASSYVTKVRAALANDPSLTMSQAMSAAGVPQAEQQQVSSALGSTKQSAT